MTTMNELGRQVFDVAVAKGWWDDYKRNRRQGDAPLRAGYSMTPAELMAQLMLVVTEVAEAAECIRDDDYVTRENETRPGKPEGLPSELADIILRTLQLAHALDIDIDTECQRKHKYNVTRQHRHGGRRL